MAKDKPLRSAYELAMERLRERDRQEGAQATQPLNASQKQEIARLRQEARAKAAELEILHRKALAQCAGDPEKIKEAEDKYAIDRGRVDSRLESAIARIKRGEPVEDV